MAFFVLEKDATSGALRLPIDGVFAAREDALSALSAAVAAGQATVSGQVFVADLDAALPVLVMPTPVAAAATPAEAPTEAAAALEQEGLASEAMPLEPESELEPELEPEPEAEEQPEEETEPEVADDEAVPAATAAVAGALAAGSLADALKRAANSLEDEGIIAPESIDAEDFSFGDDLVEEIAEVEVEEVPAGDVIEETVASVGVSEPMSATSEEPAEVLEAPADWPWANVEAFNEELTSDSDVTEIEPVTAEAVEAAPVSTQIDEPDTLITSAPPLGEDAYVPRPVILGDYADETVVEPEPVPPAEMAYEPTGELDLSTYTCNDCVYSNTCPKVGEVTPAECGTFQWRAS